MDITVVKRNGSTEPYDADKINASIKEAAQGLPDALSLSMQVASELRLTLRDGITTSELDEATILVAIQNAKDDPAYDTIATRLMLKTIYKSVLGSDGSVHDLQRAHFVDHIMTGAENGILDPRMAKIFDLDKLSDALDLSRDDIFKFIGLSTARHRYFVTDNTGTISETPQIFWMRVAMGLSLVSENPTQDALAIYDKISQMHYLPAGSTLVNAGTKNPQLSNCFVVNMEDSIDHIAHTTSNVMKISKGTGGIGLGATKLRSSGSPIDSNNTKSTGPIPFLHTIDSTLRAISRGGKKFGALCIYLENWHLDTDDFLDLREATGDSYRRIRTANTALWLSDEFMRRVDTNDWWYQFDPKDAPDLTELYGDAFSVRYAEYITKANRGDITRFKKVRAREQWLKIITKLQTTSHPWITWKDAGNVRALNNNTGTIHLSNLCTEIFLPQDEENISVCNLASINLSTHFVDGKMNWGRLDSSVRVAMRHLDNLVDITKSGIHETENSNDLNRAVGLGYMGFTDVIERMGVAYDSQAAYDFSGQIAEFISWTAIDESCNLAELRGSYPNYDGSGWSKGLVPLDTIRKLERDRMSYLKVERSTNLDWDFLRGRVSKGMRNATVMAIAPTASIGLAAGTTPGLDPAFSQLFARQTSVGKFLEVNINLVNALKDIGKWEELRGAILGARGDLDQVDGIPDSIRRVFSTSFNLDPLAFIQVAARAQVFIDQGIARNMYLSDRDISRMADVYMEAWRYGLKSTYYAHMKPRQNAEQSTVKVVKSADATPVSGASAPANGGRRGFGGRRTASVAEVAEVAAPPVVEPVAVANPAPALSLVSDESIMAACPIDPQERENCEACQ